MILFTCILLFSVGVNAQDFEEMPSISLEVSADYEEHEELVLQCADYLLKHDVEYQKRNRALVTQFLMRWMMGSEVTFEIGSDFVKYGGKDGERTTIYLAAMVTVVLNFGEEMSQDKMDKKTADMFLNYCSKYSNLKRNKAIKKELKNYSVAK